MKKIIEKASVLIEALPYIKSFHGKVTVIKYGGSAIEDNRLREGILQDIVFMSYVGMKPVLVHGGGPAISARMRKCGIEPKFTKGLRVTDGKTIKIVEEVLSVVNKKIVQEIKILGGNAAGLSGKKDGLIKVRKSKIGELDLGYVGEIVSINPEPLNKLIESDTIPVIMPLGIGSDRKTYNINADDVSAGIAASLSAEKLVLLTNVRGILENVNDEGSLFSTVNIAEIEKLLERKVIEGGMIPKVRACIRALETGVKKTHIIDARVSHSLLLEIFTKEGIGTEIVRNGYSNIIR